MCEPSGKVARQACVRRGLRQPHRGRNSWRKGPEAGARRGEVGVLGAGLGMNMQERRRE